MNLETTDPLAGNCGDGNSANQDSLLSVLQDLLWSNGTMSWQGKQKSESTYDES